MQKYTKSREEWIGQRFFNQVVIDKLGEKDYEHATGPKDHKYHYVSINDVLLVRCDCGREREATAKSLLRNKPSGCRFCAKKRVDSPIGEQSGSLVVEECIHKRTDKGRSVIWFLCRCITCNGKHQSKADVFRQGESSCPNCRLSGRFVASQIKNRTMGKYYSSIINGCKKRKLEEYLSVDFLEKLLEKQNFMCSLSGVAISVFDGSASLDRIDNQQGYLPDNVQWVHRCVNFMKSDLLESDFIKFCSSISCHMKTGHSLSSVSEQP